jgi:precorrin-4 methylase
MAQRRPTITFDDIPLEQARQMGRGPRMDPELYNALKQKIQSLRNTATRMALAAGTNSTTIKNRSGRAAAEMKIPVTIRRVSGGLLLWRSITADLQQAQETAQRLQGAQRRRSSRPGRRRA